MLCTCIQLPDSLLSQLAVTINNVTLYCNADVTADSIGNFFNLTMETEVYCCLGNTCWLLIDQNLLCLPRSTNTHSIMRHIHKSSLSLS